MKKAKQVKCGNCGYDWFTSSDKLFVCCPSCMRKVKIVENVKGGLK